MSMDYIRRTYGVSAEVGRRIEYSGSGEIEHGTITGSDDARLLITLDGDDAPRRFHPTWEIKYATPPTKEPT